MKKFFIILFLCFLFSSSAWATVPLDVDVTYRKMFSLPATSVKYVVTFEAENIEMIGVLDTRNYPIIIGTLNTATATFPSVQDAIAYYSPIALANLTDAANDAVTTVVYHQGSMYSIGLNMNSLLDEKQATAPILDEWKDLSCAATSVAWIDGTGALVCGTEGAFKTAFNITAGTAISGTGFVKASGATISYDNSTYLTTTSAASTYATNVNLATKLTANSAITGATKTKLTYDASGLVTAGADATTADIADSTNKRYVTDAQKTVIGNTSGANTGDQDLSSLALKATTVNGQALSSNVTVTTISGNAGTATALSANGSNCTSGQVAAGVDASGNAEGCALLPTVTAFAVGSPNSRSISLATAYQCTDNTKPCAFTITVSCPLTSTLLAGSVCSGEVRLGTTSGVASGSGVNIAPIQRSATGLLGFSGSDYETKTINVPTGGYIAVRQTGTTAGTGGVGTLAIAAALDQSTSN